MQEKSEILLEMIDEFNDLLEKKNSSKQSSLIPLYLLSETNSKEAIMLHEYFGVCHINMTLFNSLMDTYTPNELKAYLYIQLMAAFIQINSNHDFNKTVLDKDYRDRLMMCCYKSAVLTLINYKGIDLDLKILDMHYAHFSKKIDSILDKRIFIDHDSIENTLMNIIIQFHPKERIWRLRNKLEKAKNVRLLMISKDGIERWIFTLKENGKFVDISNVCDYHYMMTNILMNPSNYSLGELID